MNRCTRAWGRSLSDSVTLLPVSGQFRLASVQTDPLKYKIHRTLGSTREGRTCAITRSNRQPGREYGMRGLMQFAQEFRYAVRSLSRAKGLSLTVIITLA